MPQAPRNTQEFSGLMELVKTLRGPEGCPWDKEQTPQTLAPYAIEEIYEMVEALESGNDQLLKEELGDVLFQVALHAEMASERNSFRIEEVFSQLIEKMVRRHPHVFADVKVKDSTEVWQNWEKIKAKEKTNKSPFASIPQPLPSLQRAYKIGVKTEKMKFDWPRLQDVFAKLDEELAELKNEIPPENLLQKKDFSEAQLERIEHEMGDVLFSLAQISRHLDLEPEQCLRKACGRFEKRFELMRNLIQQNGLDWEKMPDAQKENFWQKAKETLRDQ